MPPEDDEPITIDELIESFDGDMRAVIETLVIANQHLLEEREEARRTNSFGFTRGRYRQTG